MTYTQDVERTGISDVTPVQGNPPEGSYRILGVGPDVRTWGDGGKMREYKVSLRNHAGVEKHGVELSRFQDKPAPRVGEDVTGSIETHGKFVKLKETKTGGVGGGWRGGVRPDNSKSIQAQTAAKAGVEIALAAAGGQPVDPATLTQNAIAAARLLNDAIREMAA